MPTATPARTATPSAGLLIGEQVRVLIEGVPGAVGGNLLLTVVNAALLWHVVGSASLTVWALLLFAAQGTRIALRRVFLRQPARLAPMRWLTLLRASVLLGGIAWGLLPVMAFPTDAPHQALPALVMIGIAGAALAGLSCDKRSVYLFSCTALLPLITRLLIDGGNIRLAMGGLVALFLAYVLVAAVRSERVFVDVVALRETASRQNDALSMAQEVAQLGSFEWCPQTRELRWSDTHFRLWGLRPGEVVPDYALFLNAVHPDDRAAVDAEVQRALAGDVFEIVFRIVRPDGSERYIQGIGGTVISERGDADRMLGTVQDVTERIRAEQALMLARDDAEIANRAKSEFLASMSHELRTPMNAILGYGQLMQDSPDLPDSYREFADEILHAGHHLLHLINELLDLSRIEAGRLELHLANTPLSKVIGECLALTETQAAEQGVTLHRTGLAEASAQADGTRLKQCLLNLLSNAIKYNRAGGTVTIELGQERDGAIWLAVADTGPGMPAEKLAQLFQPFNRLGRENSAIEGTGIGLTITRKLLALMDGTIEVSSTVDLGSRFTIRLLAAHV